jgi:hypothetical protein
VLGVVLVVDWVAAVPVPEPPVDTEVVPSPTVATVPAEEGAVPRAMPTPRALARPRLTEATRARLREAGCGRFVPMPANLRIRREPMVRPG